MLVVVPSHVFGDVLRQAKPHLAADARIAWATKGLEPDSGRLLGDVAREALGDAVPLAVISGPTFARELAAGLPTAISVAATDDAFADELERHAGIPHGYTLALLARPGWQGGDAWFACFLGRAVQASCRSVVRERSRAGTDATWTAVAAGFDARPGSPAYAALRPALADSYRRWDRPLQPDAALKRALREREQRQAEAVR